MAWETEYSHKLATAAEALRVVESGMRVLVHASSGFPATLVDALTDRAPSLRDVEIVHLLTLSQIRTAEQQYPEDFRRPCRDRIWHGGFIWKKCEGTRAELLTGIAHPSFRNELYKHRVRARWLERNEVIGPALANAAAAG
jgi:acyl-CoA hydrolase